MSDIREKVARIALGSEDPLSARPQVLGDGGESVVAGDFAVRASRVSELDSDKPIGGK